MEEIIYDKINEIGCKIDTIETLLRALMNIYVQCIDIVMNVNLAQQYLYLFL